MFGRLVCACGCLQAVYPAVAVTSSETGFGVQPLRELMVQAAMLDMWSAFPDDDPGLSSDDEAALEEAGVTPNYSDVGGSHVVRRRSGYAGVKDATPGQMSGGMGRRGPDLPPIMLMERSRKPTPKSKRSSKSKPPKDQ